MPRELKVQTNELGKISLFVIYQQGDRWEPDWAELQGQPITELIPVVTKAEIDAALRGWSRPLFDKLSLAPKLVLRKLPVADRTCAHTRGCVLHEASRCHALSGKMPTCYQPGGIVGENARYLGFLVLSYWKAGVYVLVVKEDTDA